ncbi:MAG: hypothetical protein DLM54_01275 [Acidimicrobiales bacterium]|nr:MAG: hypothetical protein DLM54_01275 [Acidimicrobiales bacterium]
MPALGSQPPARETADYDSAHMDSPAITNGQGMVDDHKPVIRFRTMGLGSRSQELPAAQPPRPGAPAGRQPHEEIVDSLRALLADIRAQSLDSQQMVQARLDRIEERLERVEDALASPTGGQRRVVSRRSSPGTRPQQG